MTSLLTAKNRSQCGQQTTTIFTTINALPHFLVIAIKFRQFVQPELSETVPTLFYQLVTVTRGRYVRLKTSGMNTPLFAIG
jgi:hypothetical protein